ncbi:hypothetical protein CC1G_05621 [Coprinopsis cinerea okayama7|uniref:DUF6533 domain-containing protein n=1 Tax=Coprinopsis cinerea (strain Okayama-7 / 130 / ATCC MYA-4618 / FGSC 9003) TaxID=240176 RepID=A8P1N6_COPC7|nr:hypothetical protein CC1G_05621 [Coprinopsis cinerea okayama7\|eukprot:XP_001838140.2 hypothetical protein CC1G_05621 [Coprinopsis cinerea okayama7\
MADLEALIEFMKVAQASRCSKVAAITFLVCDISYTTGPEAKFIWRAKWNLSKVAYFIGRYWGLIYLLVNLVVETNRHTLEVRFSYSSIESVFTSSPLVVRFHVISSCDKPVHNHAVVVITSAGMECKAGDILYMTTANIISILRIYALYGRSKKILIFFTTLACVEFALEFYVSWWTMSWTTKRVMVLPFPQVTGCLSSTPDITRALLAWIPCIIVAFMFFAFTVARFRASVMGASPAGSNFIAMLKDSANFSPLLAIFTRDGSIYFFAMFVALVTGATINLYRVGFYFTTYHPWSIVIFSCACSRLVLNIHIYGGKSAPVLTTVYEEHSMQAINFRTQPHWSVSDGDATRYKPCATV